MNDLPKEGAAKRQGMAFTTKTDTVVQYRYHAFISYSHAADWTLAPALRDGLLRFATPWRVLRWINPVRSVRVFQDQASLSANPALWPTIEEALIAADWFILLASPNAAASPWIGKEVEFWCRHRTVQKLLIVQTAGEITWDSTANDFDWPRTEALPKQLAKAYQHEPRWIDARWARTSAQATLRDPRFRDLVAELAAPLRGVPKDELIGEDIRQHRLLNRWRNAALSVVTLLVILAAVSAAIAFKQRQAAIAERDQASRNESRAFSKLAENEAERGSPASAIRIALAAVPRFLSADQPYAPQALGAVYFALSRLHERRRFDTKGVPISVSFSPDGQILATGSNLAQTQLLDVSSGREIDTLRGHELTVLDDIPIRGHTFVVFSPDGSMLATGSGDSTARLWNVLSRKEIAVLRGHKKEVTALAFSPDGRMLATGSGDETARLWEVATGRAVGVFRNEGGVTSIAFSPNGRTLGTTTGWRADRSSPGDHTARLWDVPSGQLVSTLRGHNDAVTAIAFNADGRVIATGSDDETTRLWDTATGREIATLRGHRGTVNCLAFSPDGSLIAVASGDNYARLWDVNLLREVAVLRGHEKGIKSIAFNRNGRELVTGSYDETVRLWDLAPATFDVAVGFGETSVGSTPADPDEAPVGSVAFSPDGRVIAAVEPDNAVRLWESRSRRLISTLRGHDKPVTAVAFSPDGRLLVTSSEDETTRLWEVASGLAMGIFRGHKDAVRSVAFGPSGSAFATASDDHTARLWDIASGKSVATFQGHEGSVEAVAISPNGKILATGSADTTAKLWDLTSARVIRTLSGHEDVVTAIAFSPNGRLLATSSGQNGDFSLAQDHTARLWDVPSGQLVSTLRGHNDAVTAIAFNADGRVIATGSDDETTRLWDVASGREIMVLTGHQKKGVTSVAFSPVHDQLGTGSRDGTTRLWPIGQQLIDLACARVRDLPLLAFDKDVFGLDAEWCTREVSSAICGKLGTDCP